MSGMWADFIRLDLAIENMTGKYIEYFFLIIKLKKKYVKFVFANFLIDNGILLNAATSFLDASPIYNSISCEGSLIKVTKTELGHLKLTPCTRFVNIHIVDKKKMY